MSTRAIVRAVIAPPPIVAAVAIPPWRLATACPQGFHPPLRRGVLIRRRSNPKPRRSGVVPACRRHGYDPPAPVSNADDAAVDAGRRLSLWPRPEAETRRGAARFVCPQRPLTVNALDACLRVADLDPAERPRSDQGRLELECAGIRRHSDRPQVAVDVAAERCEVSLAQVPRACRRRRGPRTRALAGHRRLNRHSERRLRARHLRRTNATGRPRRRTRCSTTRCRWDCRRRRRCCRSRRRETSSCRRKATC